MSILDKIPAPIISFLVEHFTDGAKEVWHLMTGATNPSKARELATHAAEALASKAYNDAKAELGGEGQLKDAFATLGERAKEMGDALDTVFHLANTIDEQSATIRELRAKIEELEATIATSNPPTDIPGTPGTPPPA